MSEQHSESDTRPVVIFDGECALCNRFVAWLMRADRLGIFLYTPNSSEFAQAILSRSGRLSIAPESVVVVSSRGVFERSDAVLEVCHELGAPFSTVRLLGVIPRVIRDGAYLFVARRRLRWFGSVSSCGLIPPELRDRIR